MWISVIQFRLILCRVNDIKSNLIVENIYFPPSTKTIFSVATESHFDLDCLWLVETDFVMNPFQCCFEVLKGIMRSLQQALMRANKTFLPFFLPFVQSELCGQTSLECAKRKGGWSMQEFNSVRPEVVSLQIYKGGKRYSMGSTSGIHWDYKIPCGSNKSINK